LLKSFKLIQDDKMNIREKSQILIKSFKA